MALRPGTLALLALPVGLGAGLLLGTLTSPGAPEQSPAAAAPLSQVEPARVELAGTPTIPALPTPKPPKRSASPGAGTPTVSAAAPSSGGGAPPVVSAPRPATGGGGGGSTGGSGGAKSGGSGGGGGGGDELTNTGDFQ